MNQIDSVSKQSRITDNCYVAKVMSAILSIIDLSTIINIIKTEKIFWYFKAMALDLGESFGILQQSSKH